MKEYDFYDKLIFEGELVNGYINNGKGIVRESCYIIFEGEFLNGEKWNGKLKEYDNNGKLLFETEYINGKGIKKTIK